jgi:hypothetical protein
MRSAAGDDMGYDSREAEKTAAKRHQQNFADVDLSPQQLLIRELGV